MIRTVPGANVGPDGTEPDGTGGSATVVESFDFPTRTPTTRTTISATTDRPTTRPAGKERGFDGGGTARETDRSAGGGGARTGDRWTATPGPAGVVTSDQAAPFHQRTKPGAPSGSGYQPGAGGVFPGSLTPEL